MYYAAYGKGILPQGMGRAGIQAGLFGVSKAHLQSACQRERGRGWGDWFFVFA
jgi:hypothetical protein